MIALGSRCCAEGQRLNDSRCEGRPRACLQGFELLDSGCVARTRRVRIAAGHFKLGPGDWEAQGVVQPREIVIDQAYGLDVYEATVAGWNDCVKAGACAGLMREEPGRPARGVTFEQARQYCAWAGGTLPTDDEWLFAAAGDKARRYPWGDTGAVCSRAGWGLAHGPCAQGDAGPDWTGIHPGDVTPDGIADMGGSVAEWVVRADGTATTRGGCWASSFAAELRTWHESARAPTDKRDDTGMRCRYAVESAAGPAVLPSASP
jgi:formylglycine-generating enzyme required for sulfatase activity